MHSVTTDYVKDTGSPAPYLRRIADAGFSHVHWCHQWNTDFLYADSEIDEIGKWFKQYGLQLNDLHASEGQEKFWVSPQEYARQAGVELVKNRINMAARLGSDVVIMHVRAEPEQTGANELFWGQLQKSLDEIEPYAKKRGVRIAAENLGFNFNTLEKLLTKYGPDYVGLCYDSGHANFGADKMERLESVKERLIAVHLHDNDGSSDQHKLPFDGTVDWPGLTRILAASSYAKCVNLEVMIHNTGIEEESVFLKKAYECGTRLAEMIDSYQPHIRIN